MSPDLPGVPPVSSATIGLLRYVVAFFLAQVALGLGMVAFVYLTGQQPKLSSTPAIIAALAPALLWYRSSVNLAMTKAQIIKFSIGTSLADTLNSSLWFFVMMLDSGLPLGWEAAAYAIGTDNLRTAQISLLAGLTVGPVTVFFVSAVFARLMTKGLPVHRTSGPEFNNTWDCPRRLHP